LVSHTEDGAKSEVFENRMLRKIFGLERDEVNRERKDYKMRRFMVFTFHHM